MLSGLELGLSFILSFIVERKSAGVIFFMWKKQFQISVSEKKQTTFIY